MRKTLTATAVTLAALTATAAPAHAAGAPHVTAEASVTRAVQGHPVTVTVRITGTVTAVHATITDGFLARTVTLKHSKGTAYAGRVAIPAASTSGAWDVENFTGVTHGHRIDLDPQWVGFHGFTVTGPLSLGGR